MKHNINPIERYNEDVKQRYKIMRSFKSFESANAFLSLRRIIYNFVRGNETRAMKAGIALEQTKQIVTSNKILNRNILHFEENLHNINYIYKF